MRDREERKKNKKKYIRQRNIIGKRNRGKRDKEYRNTRKYDLGMWELDKRDIVSRHKRERNGDIRGIYTKREM